MNKTYLMVPVKPVKYDLVSEIDKFIHVPLATYDTYGSVKIGSGLIVDRGVVSFDEELIPTELSELNQDEQHRLVTDEQISFWNNKIDNSNVLNVKNEVVSYNGSEVINKNSLNTTLTKYYNKSETDTLLNEKTDNTTTEKLTERVVENETNIDVLTQNKANKSDIIDNLTTNNSNQMLSARQGYRLNNMINDINTLLKSDNINLDTIQEIVNYIENNKDLIDSIMLTKVNISDVIDNLTTTDSTKPLSANQGVVLKEFIDALPEWAKQPTKPTYYYSEILERPTQVRVSITKVGIPTKVSQLENDSNFATETFVNEELERSIPTRTSQLQNDSDFTTNENVQDNVTEINSKITNLSNTMPRKTSDLQNDGDGESLFATEQFVATSITNLELEDKLETIEKSIPNKTSQLTNDSNFATEQFVEQNGGKIDSISINGEQQTIDANKNVDIVLPENIAVTNQNNNFTTSQTINGTLTINGDIVQNGSSYETHAEQVYTSNDVITLREGAVGGLEEGKYAGFEAEKYDGENTGILGFGADGVARVGDKGNEQPLLTREESSTLIDGEVMVWNATNNRAEGSSDFVKTTDYATNSKAGVVKAQTVANTNRGVYISSEGYLSIKSASEAEINEKTNSLNVINPQNLDLAVKSGLANSKIEWSDNEKLSARILLGAISNTDYGSHSKTGVIKATSEQGFYISPNDGSLSIVQATEKNIDERTNPWRPITSNNLDYAVNSVLKERVTLTLKENDAYTLTINKG